MTWLTWRQYRFQLYVAAALLAAFGVVIVITGRQIAARLHANAAACATGHGCIRGSGLFMGSHVVGFLVIATLGAPVLFGLFWGAPLVAGELEAGTIQFAWMQSVTRRYWLAVKAGWLLLAAAVWGGAIAALVTWWYAPGNALDLDQFDPGHFDLLDIVPVGYAVFAMALGICAGAVLRRTLPAMAVTLGGFIAVRVLVTLLLRPHYMSPVTTFYGAIKGYAPAGSFWQMARGVYAPSGHLVTVGNNEPVLDGVPVNQLPASCAHAGNTLPASCQSVLEHFRGFITYQPASRYWTFQGIETGIFVALAAILLAVTAVLLVRRDA
jgi:ABC-2 family transporter protein